MWKSTFRSVLCPYRNLTGIKEWRAEDLTQNKLRFRLGSMIEAGGLWVDPVLKNTWADLKWLIQNDFRESFGNVGK